MSFARWLAHVAAAGFGIGLYDTLINAAVVERYREAAARPMSLLHAAATVGAMSGPLLAAALAGARRASSRSFHAAGARTCVLAAVGCARRASPRRPRATPTRGGGAQPQTRSVAAGARPLRPSRRSPSPTSASRPRSRSSRCPTRARALALPAGARRLRDQRLLARPACGRVGVLALPVALGAAHARRRGRARRARRCSIGVATQHGVVEATFFATGAALGCVYPLIMALVGDARRLGARHARRGSRPEPGRSAAPRCPG